MNWFGSGRSSSPLFLIRIGSREAEGIGITALFVCRLGGERGRREGKFNREAKPAQVSSAAMLKRRDTEAGHAPALASLRGRLGDGADSASVARRSMNAFAGPRVGKPSFSQRHTVERLTPAISASWVCVNFNVRRIAGRSMFAFVICIVCVMQTIASSRNAYR